MLSQSSIDSSPSGFDSLKLISPICRAVREEKYKQPTPIQVKAIPHLLNGRDLLGCAQTGTGKTAAFALPILQQLVKQKQKPEKKQVRTLILTPTRELALQIDESFRVYGRYLKLNQAVIFGGVRPKNQIRDLYNGVDILVATPGRLLDLIQQKHLHINKIDMLVLDEADRMLDMGFLPDIKKIISMVPANRQTILFSATLPNEVISLTQKFLVNPVQVSISPPSSTVKKIKQRVLFVERENKSALLESILENVDIQRVLVFTRTKHGANRIAKRLTKNRIRTEALHGDKSQTARIQALKKFRSGYARVLVATDVASRGLDVDGITHVINYELPEEAESYIHRIGRTARAGAEGMALSFCDAGEKGYLRKIERTIKCDVTVEESHPYHCKVIASKGSKSKGKNRTKNNTPNLKARGHTTKFSKSNTSKNNSSKSTKFSRKFKRHKSLGGKSR